jgi:Ca2+:H+ antiporter
MSASGDNSAAAQRQLTADRLFLVPLLIAFPAPVVSHFLFPGTNTFILCCVALIPLARLMGEATEVIAHKLGAGLGGLMNASFGNAAEHSTAVLMAWKNKMDLAFNIAFESSKQVALFVAPILVLLSIPLGHPLALEFGHMEVVGMGVGVGAATLIGLDGESNWLEGAMLLGVYAILAVAFFFVP